MSQATQALKHIAAQPVYQNLAKAIQTTDYDNMFQYYAPVSELIEKTQAEILDRIRALPRNTDKDCNRFQAAFSNDIVTLLPEWHWLDSIFKEQYVFDGEVVSFGSKGDPLVKTSHDKVVVLMDSSPARGTKVKLEIIRQGRKVDYGRVFELTPDNLYRIISQNTLNKIALSLEHVEDGISSYSPHAAEDRLSSLSELLTVLHEVREMAIRLRKEEREKALLRVMEYRKRLLRLRGADLVFELLSQKEETEILELYQGDEQQLAISLSAPGLLCYRAYQTLKTDIFAGKELRQVVEIRKKMENEPQSLEIALELAELKWRTESVYPIAMDYIRGMDELYHRFRETVMKVALAIAEEEIYHAEDIREKMERQFSDEYISTQLREVFRNREEFYHLRGGMAELKAVMGDDKSIAVESALKPYLDKYWY